MYIVYNNYARVVMVAMTVYSNTLVDTNITLGRAYENKSYTRQVRYLNNITPTE